MSTERPTPDADRLRTIANSGLVEGYYDDLHDIADRLDAQPVRGDGPNLDELRALSDAATQEPRYWEPNPHGHTEDHCRCGSCYGPTTVWDFGCMDDCCTFGGPGDCEHQGFRYEDAAFVQAAVAYVRARLAAPPATEHRWKRNGPWTHEVGPDACVCGKGWPCPDAAPPATSPEPDGEWYVVCSASYSRGGFSTEDAARDHAAKCAYSSRHEDGASCRHRVEFRPAPEAPATANADRPEPLRHDGSCVNCGQIGSHSVTCWWWMRFGAPATADRADEWRCVLADRWGLFSDEPCLQF